MIREFCAENTTNVREAIEAGADRIELCDRLDLGGVTPVREVIDEAVALVHGLGARVMVMVRPRGGDFAYSEPELCQMERAIGVAREAGTDGVVFGCVRNGSLDELATRRLARVADGLDMTFHMAFDEIDSSLQVGALATLAELGFSRVLSHGGPLSAPIEGCLPRLRELSEAAVGRIVVMPGGGVSWQNAECVAATVGTGEVHGTRIVRLS